ncbi:MAG: 30S ribosomal protein S20 [Dethiobacteria bacterium]|nr:30S ribosomal protein S20 [Bacillota bacterium]
MPNIKSAIKRVKVSEKRRLRNRAIKSKVKTAIKRFNAVLASGDKEQARAELSRAMKTIDQAAAKGVLHKNNAARKKSRLSRAFNKAV